MTLEEGARAWANERCSGQDECDIVWCMCVEDFMMGAKSERAAVIAEVREELMSGEHDLGLLTVEWVEEVLKECE